MNSIVQPYTYHLIVWTVTLLLATFFGFVIGMIVSERRFANPKRTASRPHL